MKNQVQKPNSDLIEKTGIFGDQIYFLPPQLDEINGEIKKKQKFIGQLRVKLHKTKSENRSKKTHKFKATIEIWQG